MIGCVNGCVNSVDESLEETSNYIYALDVDENDRLITGGNALFKKEGYYWGVPTPQLCRVNTDGSLDNTFGDNGLLRSSITFV